MVAIVLKMDLHCETCAAKVERIAMKISGVETVTTNLAANRVVVTGTADASRVIAKLEKKSRRSITVVNDTGDATEDGAASPASPVLTPIRLDPRVRIVEPDPPPAPEAAYYYPGQGGGYGYGHGVQDWTTSSYYQSTGGYPEQEGVYGGQHGTPPDDYQQWTSGYYNYYSQGEGPPGDVAYDDQYQQGRDDNAGSNCSIQ